MVARTPPRLVSDLTPTPLAAFLGDSVTKGDSVALANVFAGRSYPTIACQQAGGALRLWINAGVAGDRTAQMLARVDADVIRLRTPKPGRCIVLGGTNDVADATPIAQTLANLIAIYGRLRAAGIQPVGATIPPRAPFRTRVAWLNLAIKDACEGRGLPCLDFHAVLVDPATGGYKPGYDDDGIHPGPAGQRAMAAVVAAALPAPTVRTPALSQDNADAVNLLDGSLFLVDGNADGVGDGWVNNAGTGAIAPSIETGDTAILGNWQVLTTTAAGQKIVSQTVPAGTPSPRGWTAGDVLECALLIDAQNVEAGGGIAPFVDVLLPGTAGTAVSPIYGQKVNIARGFCSVRFAVPAGTSGMTVRLNSSLTAVGTGVVKFAQPALYNLTRLGIA